MSVKTILIVSCTTKKVEQDIDGLCSGLEQKKYDKGHSVTPLSFHELQDLCKSKNKQKPIDEICFVGHSGFHKRNKGGSLTPRKIADREIGPYPLEEVARVSVEALSKLKTSTFKFFACESAVNELTYHRNDKNVVKITEKFSTEEMQNLSSLIENKKDSKISSIQYVAMQLFNKLNEMGNSRQIRVVGVNGVAYMISGRMRMRAFDIEYASHFKEAASNVEKALALSSSKKKTAKLEEAIQREETLLNEFIKGRKSAHKIEYAISVDENFEEDSNHTSADEITLT